MATHETEGTQGTQGPSRRQFIGGSAAAIGGIAAATMLSGDGASAATGALRRREAHRHDQGRQARRDPDAGEPLLRPLLRRDARRPRVRRPAGAAAIRTGRTSSTSRTARARGAPYLLPWHMDTRQYDAQDAGDLDHSWSGTHSAWNTGAWNHWIASQGRADDGLLQPRRHPVPVRARRRVHDLRRLPLLGPGPDDAEPAVPLDRHDRPGRATPAARRSTTRPTTSRSTAGRPIPERLQAAGVTWQVYANDEVGDGDDGWVGDYGDNPLWLFQAYHDSLNSTDPAKQDLARRASLRKQWKPDSRPGPGRQPRPDAVHRRRARPGPCRRCRGSSRRTATASTRPRGRSTAPTTPRPC